MAPDPNELNDKSKIEIVWLALIAFARIVAPLHLILFQCSCKV